MTAIATPPRGPQPIPDFILSELAEYEEHIHEFRRGEIGEVKMQKIRLQFGTYAQRQDGVQMQRIKIPGAILTADQLICLADAGDRFGSGFVHFTTREDAQLYYLKLEEAPELMRFLASYGITSREACGNTVRNITACYRSGTSPTEVFDVAPYAHALFRYLVRNDHNQVMGRKFKITFEGCTEDHSAVRFHDIGFLAKKRIENGKERLGFLLHVGGGLGGAPMISHVYSEFLPVEEMYNFASALLRLFDRYGERKSRMKARMKFLVQSMGWERFKDALDQERELVGPVPFPAEDLEPAHQPIPEPGAPRASHDPRTHRPEFKRWQRDSVLPHKLPGLKGVNVRLRLGDIVSDKLRSLGEVVRRYSGSEARVSVDQNLFLPWVRETELPDLYEALSGLELADAGSETAEDITTCPAADTCRLGIASAKGLGSALSAALEPGGELAQYTDSIRDVKIKISGCPNGCAQHAIADIGFHSAAMTENKRTVPSYLLFIGGKQGMERAQIGGIIGKYPAKRGIKLLGALLELYTAERQQGEDFTACMTRLGDDRLKALLEPFRAVPSFESDPSFYQDWGHANEKFAVRQGVKGECAGTTIAEKVPSREDAEEALAQADAYVEHKAWDAAIYAAYDAAAAGARVPLYKRLVDPFTSEQVLWEFENIFVLSGQTDGAWPDLRKSFDTLRSVEPSEAAARAILERAREFVAYSTEFFAEPIKFSRVVEDAAAD
ncbi:MAG TPA: nitrite/sulfite reductase [Gemmatimonadales bacterium]|nr:nitrite/sulfite reductase [Gemmatimonadales bacterium]